MTKPEVELSAEDLAKAYFLHPSDHPGLLLVSTVFDGNGFGSWKRAMKRPQVDQSYTGIT